VWRFHKKLKIEVPYIHSWHISENTKNTNSKDTCTPVSIPALCIIVKIWKQSKCPSMDERIKTMWYIYTHTMEYYSAIKNNGLLPFATNMDRP
jgi:hypothetical protein